MSEIKQAPAGAPNAPVPVVVAPAPAKPAHPKEMRFRRYSELICFLPVALMGVLFWALGKWVIDAPQAFSYVWLLVFMSGVIGASYNFNIWYTAAIMFFLGVAAPLANLWSIPFVESFMMWATKDYGVVPYDVMLTFSKWFGILFVGEWAVRRLFFYDVSSNRLETNAIPNDEEALDLRGVAVRSHYPNGFKQFILLGTGDLVFSRNGIEFRRIEDIPFLWFFWPRMERMLESTAVNVVESPQ